MKDHFKTTVDSTVALSTSTVGILLSCKGNFPWLERGGGGGGGCQAWEKTLGKRLISVQPFTKLHSLADHQLMVKNRTTKQ